MGQRIVQWLISAILVLGCGLCIADDFAEPEPEDFAYPVPWLKSGPAKERMYYSSSRNRLFKLGWEGSPSQAVNAARTEYEAARKRCSDDPRLDYAFGLALWRNDRRPEAIQQFDMAARLSGDKPPFLPAAQAAAWSRMLEGQRDPGLKQIVQIAKVLNKSKGDFPTPTQKVDSALFLGRAVGFLTGPGSSNETAESDKPLLNEVESLIPVELVPRFISGRAQIAERHAELLALAARPAVEVNAEYLQKKIGIEQQMTASRAEAKRLVEENDTDGKTHRQVMKESTVKINQVKQDLMQIQMGLQMAAAAVLKYSQPEKHYDVQRVETKEKDDDGKTRYRTEKELVERPENSSERNARLANLTSAQALGNQLLQRRETSATELNRLQMLLYKSNSDHQKAVAAFRTDRSLQMRLQRELAMKSKQVEQDYIAPAELKSRVGTIAPYVPWDVNVEREGLLASYKITLPEATTH
jgi:hypothetical protein